MAVYVLDRRKNPLNPCSERRARILLARGRARVHRKRPFVIRLVDVSAKDVVLIPLAVCIDPGSKKTGLAVRRAFESGEQMPPGREVGLHVHILNLMEIEHRGESIRSRLTARGQFRRRRRARLRYRKARYWNRSRANGWLDAPSRHRVESIVSQLRRLVKFAPIRSVVKEANFFNLQQMRQAAGSSITAKQATLTGVRKREYLLEKWQRRCAYCGKTNRKLQMEHIRPRSRGGSDSATNLCLACARCNRRKGVLPVHVFLASAPYRLKQVLADSDKMLDHAAATNRLNWALEKYLERTHLTLTTSAGWQTKRNRIAFQIPKTHALDAACCGNIAGISGWQRPTLLLKACGRGRYCRTLVDAFGFPRAYRARFKQLFGYVTGDLVRAVVTKGKKQGIHTGRVAVKSRGYFKLTTDSDTFEGIHHSCLRLMQRGDGFASNFAETPRDDSHSNREKKRKNAAILCHTANGALYARDLIAPLENEPP